MMNNKLEMTFVVWMRWQNWMEENRAVNDAAEDPDSRYHRMAAPVKMSKKRLRGLLIASGAQPRRADAYLKRMHSEGYNYMEIWGHNKYTLVPRIVRRTETMAAGRLFHALFGDKPIIDSRKQTAYLQKVEAERKAKYEADKALVDAHPEIRSQGDAIKAKARYLMSCTTLKEDGTRVLDSEAFDMNKVRDFGRLSTWYSFTDWYMRNCSSAG